MGRYEILLPIASGGMATVFLARARGAHGFERDVALKLTHAHLVQSPEFVAMLLEEGKLASRIRHQNVVPVLDVGDDPRGIFLVMEYVEGDTLSGLLRRTAQGATAGGDPQAHQVPTAIGMRILLDALAGLHAAHELTDEHGVHLGVVHRDFSPQNVLVGVDGVSKLTDFGIAKAANRAGHTATGMLKGKAAYMAPEQALAQSLDRRADVWAAGVLAWELLTGIRLHPLGDEMATLLKVVTTTPPRVDSVRPDVPLAVADVVARALARNASERWPTAQIFARELAAALNGNVQIADAEGVAGYLSAIAGAKLAARRARVNDALRRGSEMRALDMTAASMRSLATPSAGGDDIAGIVLVGDEMTRTKTALADDLSSPRETPPSRSRSRRALGWLGAAAVFGILSAGAWTFREGVVGVTPARAPEMANETSSASAASRAPPESPSSAAAAAGAPGAAGAPTDSALASSSAPASNVVQVHANAPIASLRLDKHVLSIPSPTKEISIERPADERERVIKVFAVSADGRQASATLVPQATSLRLEFAAGRASPRAPTTGGAPEPTNANASTPSTAPTGLAPSPYK